MTAINIIIIVVIVVVVVDIRKNGRNVYVPG